LRAEALQRAGADKYVNMARIAFLLLKSACIGFDLRPIKVL
jgi:hypothetical protein